MVSPAARVFPGRALAVSACAGLGLYLLCGLHGGLVLFSSVVGFMMAGGWRYVKLVVRTLPRDLG